MVKGSELMLCKTVGVPGMASMCTTVMGFPDPRCHLHAPRICKSNCYADRDRLIAARERLVYITCKGFPRSVIKE